MLKCPVFSNNPAPLRTKAAGLFEKTLQQQCPYIWLNINRSMNSRIVSLKKHIIKVFLPLQVLIVDLCADKFVSQVCICVCVRL